MKISTVYSVLWVLWVLSFCAIEFTALLSGHPEGTLSEKIWALERLHHAWTFTRFFIAAFCLWLSLHMVLGVFR